MLDLQQVQFAVPLDRMPSPFSTHGVIEVDHPQVSSLSAAMSAVERALRQEMPSGLERRKGTICFHAGLFRSGKSRNLLIPITRGELKFRWEDGRLVIRYWLSFLQMFIAVTAMSVFSYYATKMSWQATSMVWGWMFGLNYLLARLRFQRFIRKAVERPR